jgi:hypothetical protein
MNLSPNPFNRRHVLAKNAVIAVCNMPPSLPTLSARLKRLQPNTRARVYPYCSAVRLLLSSASLDGELSTPDSIEDELIPGNSWRRPAILGDA